MRKDVVSYVMKTERDVFVSFVESLFDAIDMAAELSISIDVCGILIRLKSALVGVLGTNSKSQAHNHETCLTQDDS